MSVRLDATDASVVDARTAFVEIGDNYSAIEVKSEVDAIGARYTVKTDSNGFVQGFGMLNTGTAETSGIVFKTSNFYITNDTTNAITLPNSGTLAKNGKTLPFGIEGGKLYMQNAFIKTASIEKGDIFDLTVSNEITSSNYSSTAGWKISKNGDAVFNSLTVRVPISNVTGSITKGSSWSVSGDAPVNVAADNPKEALWGPFTIAPPVSGKAFSLLAWANITNSKTSSSWRDFNVTLFLRTTMPGGSVSDETVVWSPMSGAYNITNSCLSVRTGLTGTVYMYLRINGTNTSGTYSGKVGYVVFPE